MKLPRRIMPYALVLCFILSLPLIATTWKTASCLSYEKFSESSEQLYHKLQERFEVSEESLRHANVQPYLGNYDKLWANTIGDTFETLDGNNLIIGDSKKREFYVTSANKDLLGKVSVYYNPEIRGKRFLGINHLDELSEKLTGGKYELPRMFQETFTTDGMVFQVTVVSIKPIGQPTAYEIVMMRFLEELVTFVQKSVVERESNEKQ